MAYNPVAVEDDGDCGDWGWEAEKRLDALYEIIDGLPPLQETPNACLASSLSRYQMMSAPTMV